MKPAVYLYGVPGQYENYLAALESAGARVVLCRDLYRSLDCGGLLLPGGGDIRGPLPGTESFLIDSFARSRRPILGICRGLQALNVHWGGTLRDIPGHQLPRGDLVHPTRAEGLMARLLGEAPAVTSCHHQAVDRLAPPVQAGAGCPGGGGGGGGPPAAAGAGDPVAPGAPELWPAPGGRPGGRGPVCLFRCTDRRRTMDRPVRELNLELGRPDAAEALRRLAAEVEAARKMGTPAMKLIHGYGSSGKGGRLRTACRTWLRQQELCFLPGEEFSIFNQEARRWLALCPQLRQDRDLDAENRGVTYVLLKK